MDCQRLPARHHDDAPPVRIARRTERLQAGIHGGDSGVHARLAAVRAVVRTHNTGALAPRAGTGRGYDNERQHVNRKTHLPQTPPRQGRGAQRHRRGDSLGDRSFSRGGYPLGSHMAVALRGERARRHSDFHNGAQVSARQSGEDKGQKVQPERGFAQRGDIRTDDRMCGGRVPRPARRAPDCRSLRLRLHRRALRAHADEEEISHASLRPS